MSSETIHLALDLLPLQLWNTIYMVFTATFFSLLIGVPLGIILAMTGRGQFKENVYFYKFLETLVNIGRSFPFAILMVAVIPLTRWVVGTSLGTTASIVPLTLAAAPFVARLIEISLRKVDRHMIEAARVMGSNSWQMVTKVLLPEAFPSILSDITLTIVNLIGYSAMAGLVGGGGLGQVAIQYGYHRFNTPIMVITVLLLILLVQGFQWLGNYCVHIVYKKRGLVSHD